MSRLLALLLLVALPAQAGYFGREAETVGAIAEWILGKPYQKEIQ